MGIQSKLALKRLEETVYSLPRLPPIDRLMCLRYHRHLGILVIDSRQIYQNVGTPSKPTRPSLCLYFVENWF